MVAGALVLALAGCAGGPGDNPGAGGGWLGGKPNFSDTGRSGPLGAPFAAGEGGASGADASMMDTTTVPGPGERIGPPRAGSVDDNADYPGFLSYLERLTAASIVTRPYDGAGRIVVTVTDPDGKPAAGQQVSVTGPAGLKANLTTTADGTIRFWPGLYGASTEATYTFTAGESSVGVAAGQSSALSMRTPDAADEQLEILFVLDATGSMGDEISQLTTTIDSVASQIEALPGAPKLRFGLTVYRDEGDEFVTASYDLTDDLGAFRQALGEVRASGGGDYPEALDEALAEALTKPSWSSAGSATQLVFLVADAPPQVDRQVSQPYTDSMRQAAERGIKIFPIASSDSDDVAEAVFRQLAATTGAKFVFLSYGAGGAATGEHTDITATDYEELSLDALVVRLVSEELAHRSGTPAPPPPPPSPQPTESPNPPGQ